MKNDLFRYIEADLGLNVPFVKGQIIPVINCWHFSTDGNAVDCMFYDDIDFIDGMNRVYVVLRGYKVIILAFTLMDTHVHFVLYGDFDECNRFVHEYIRRTSMYIQTRHGERNKLDKVAISHQTVDNDLYLKTVICYVVKNAPAGGLPYMAYDYPWSSGPLYFRLSGSWSSPAWTMPSVLNYYLSGKSGRSAKRVLKTHEKGLDDVLMKDGIIFPGEYVAVKVVERLFKTCKSYNYFLCKTREDDVDAKGGSISHLTIPMREMRQYKNELCKEMFDVSGIKSLDSAKRLRLAKALRARYNSSVKQIVRLCGLVYDEVKTRIT